MDERWIRGVAAAELSRREFVERVGAVGAGAMVAGALPDAIELLAPDRAQAADGPLDATLQAFFDTIIPGRVVSRTQSGKPVHPGAIAGADPEPGAVEADALELSHHPKIGFDALAPAFVAELEALSLPQGGPFISLSYARREAVCVQGLAFSNPSRVMWEAAAAVPFTAFCAAATVVNANARTAVGYRVMGHPGPARRGYRKFSHRRRLAKGRTKRGSLP